MPSRCLIHSYVYNVLLVTILEIAAFIMHKDYLWPWGVCYTLKIILERIKERKGEKF